MSVNFEPLLSGCLCLMYLAYALFVKGGFWKSNWTGKDGSWVSSSEGPIFFLLMIILFSVLGVVLILEGLNVL